MRFPIKSLAAGLGFSSMVTLAYASRIEPNWIEIKEVHLRLPRLDRAFDGYRLVQFSDIHYETGVGRDRLELVVNLVNRQNPDMIAITGDFVTEDAAPDADDMIEVLEGLHPKDATVAILGNHDYKGGAGIIRRVIEASGIINLNNRVHTVRRGDAALHFCGVDDIYEHQDNLAQVLHDLPASGAAILLAHEPDFADTSAATGRFDLQISGHSHGGQVNIPLLREMVLPELGIKYVSGLYQIGSMMQYTNRGIGMVRPAVRVNSRPEITVFTLLAE